uniref:PDZ domain-containing protein n=1 Tax=Myotis myotis TaxID=51298 RepID=A0A7J7U6S6_MYOMY|nr:hypothetical protein mMyoMyo1_018076 [Myotis myotis]
MWRRRLAAALRLSGLKFASGRLPAGQIPTPPRLLVEHENRLYLAARRGVWKCLRRPAEADRGGADTAEAGCRLCQWEQPWCKRKCRQPAPSLPMASRTVTLRRQPVGGLGLSVKGGAEHGVPVIISKIFKDQAADQTGMLFTGDSILQVNGIHVENATHEEAVHLLRNAGSEVTITVEFLREAPSFLKLPLGSPESPSGHGSGASSPLFDSGLHLNGNPSNTAPPSPSSPIANEPKYEKRWLDSWSVPLSIARISRSQAGTETLRPHAFNVLALGVRSGMLQFSTAQETTDWLSAVATNIHDLMLQRLKMANKCCSPRDQT